MEAINQDHNLNKGEKGHGSSTADQHQILFLSENCEKEQIVKSENLSAWLQPRTFGIFMAYLRHLVGDVRSGDDHIKWLTLCLHFFWGGAHRLDLVYVICCPQWGK